MIGLNVPPRQADQLKTELSVLLGLSSSEPLVVPYARFTSKTVSKMKHDIGRLYIAMPEPLGRRCLLYVRGPNRYLVGDGSYFREVRLYLPETENSHQNVTSAIIDGTLVRVNEESSECVFYASDFYRFEGDDIRPRPYDARLSLLLGGVVRFRRQQEKLNMFPELFESDDISIDLRPYLRLKYVDTIIENPAQYIPVKIAGIVFTHRGVPLSGVRESYLWAGPFQENLVLKVDTDYAEGRVRGLVRDHGELVPVVDFGPITAALTQVEGMLVEVQLKRPDDTEWEIKGISHGDRPTSKEEFLAAVSDPSRTLYTEEDLLRDIGEIIQLPHYVEEELSKQQGVRR
jgi:hypothetical protein